MLKLHCGPSSQNPYSPATTEPQPQPKTHGSTLEERAHSFGRTVAENLFTMRSKRLDDFDEEDS